MDVHANAVAVERPQDDASLEEAHMRLSEACERTTFHRIEAERWQRIARAESARIRELHATEPVGGLSPDELLSAQPVQHHHSGSLV